MTRRFRPALSMTVFLFLLVALFSGLGHWQLRRAAEKSLAEQQFQAAERVTLEAALTTGQRFAHVSADGAYDAVHHVLLDNRVHNGQAGVHVLTPFYTVDGRAVLVNRGWLPLGADRALPEVPTPAGRITIRGRLNALPRPGRMLGEPDALGAATWPQLVTYLNIDDLSDRLDRPLENWIVQLSAQASSGFGDRDWKPVYLSADKHRAYAFQWFALAIAGVVLWIVTGFTRKADNNK